MVQLSISHMPYLEMPMAQELTLGVAMASDIEIQQGLYLDKVAATGWREAARIVHAAPTTVAYTATATMVAADDNEGWRQQRALLLEALQWCVDAGVPMIYFTSGRSGQLSPDQAVDAFCEQVAPVVARADELGIEVALENTLWLRSDLSFTHSLRETAELAVQAGMGIVADLFCAWQEHHLADTMRRHLDRIRMIQFSDFKVGTLYQPARWVPGDGDIPLQWQVDLVRDLGWDGRIDLELSGPAIEAEGVELAIPRGLAWLRAQRWR